VVKWVAPKADTPSSHGGTVKEIGDEYGLTTSCSIFVHHWISVWRFESSPYSLWQKNKNCL